MYLQKLFNCNLTFIKYQFHLRNILLSDNTTFEIKTQMLSKRFLCRMKNSTSCNVENLLCKRKFHSSTCRNALSPIVLVVLQSLTEITAMVLGRRLRISWETLPGNRKAHILNNIKRNQNNITIGFVLFSGLVCTFYITHLVEDPITRRKRFLIFSEKEVVEMARNEVYAILENYKWQLIKSGHQYNNVLRISQQILTANSHLPGTKRNWQVILINDKLKNVFVSLSGHIFIFTGMFEEVLNQDQLAAVIAHEIAHVLLCHPVEVISKLVLLQTVIPVFLLASCTLFPGSMLFTYFITKCLQIGVFYLPFSRSLELEADKLGLEMMARACYDPYQIILFWRKMSKSEIGKSVEWLSTHPSHQTRCMVLEKHMPIAMNIFEGHCTDNDMTPYLHK